MNAPATSAGGLSAADEALLGEIARAIGQARETGDRQVLVAALGRAHSLLPRLPAAFAPVLEGIEQRLASSALFSEESCSFSLGDLYEALDTWQQRARLRLHQAAAKDT